VPGLPGRSVLPNAGVWFLELIPSPPQFIRPTVPRPVNINDCGCFIRPNVRPKPSQIRPIRPKQVFYTKVRQCRVGGGGLRNLAVWPTIARTFVVNFVLNLSSKCVHRRTAPNKKRKAGVLQFGKWSDGVAECQGVREKQNLAEKSKTLPKYEDGDSRPGFRDGAYRGGVGSRAFPRVMPLPAPNRICKSLKTNLVPTPRRIHYFRQIFQKNHYKPARKRYHPPNEPVCLPR
jgi:hypothetical protein